MISRKITKQISNEKLLKNINDNNIYMYRMLKRNS